MPLINLTPHAIALRRVDGETIILDGTKTPARVATRTGPRAFTMMRVPVMEPTHLDGVQDLPPPRQGILYIVSQLTALAVLAVQPDRTDICYPDTEDADRDAQGVLSVRGLVLARRPRISAAWDGLEDVEDPD